MKFRECNKIFGLILITILILTFTLVTGCFESDSGSKKGPFTALEKKGNADEKASEWKSDPVLIGVEGFEFEIETSSGGITVPADSERGDGKCMIWKYHYYSSNSDKKYEVTVLSDGNIEVEEKEGGSEDLEIINWSIDSDELALIAEENDGSQFLDEYPHTKITYHLGMSEGDPVWSITYYDEMNTPSEMLIVSVNAKNGAFIDSTRQSL